MAQLKKDNAEVDYDSAGTTVDRFGVEVPFAPGDTLTNEPHSIRVEFLGRNRWVGHINLPYRGHDRWVKLSEAVFDSFEEAERYADLEWGMATHERSAR